MKTKRSEAGVHVRHLLLVAGPSGAGKSTFLKDLARNALPSDIMVHLPLTCHSWMQSTGGKTLRPGSNSPTPEGVELVLHYDILRPFDRGLCRDYSDDVALDALRSCDQVTLVNLRPREELLVQMLSGRIKSAGLTGLLRPLSKKLAAANPELPASRLFVPAALRSLLTRRMRVRLANKERHRRLVGLYGIEGWLNGWYRRWDEYIDGAVGQRLRMPVLHVEPAVGAAARFRLRCATHV